MTASRHCRSTARPVAEPQQYLANPQKSSPGTKMPFAGLHDQKKVDDIAAYLATFNEKGEKAAE